VTGSEPPTAQFEAERPRLRALAYRMLGSLSEADDAVQETWLRLSRTDPATIDHLSAWLTTVVSRVCLNLLRARATRREEPMTAWVPDPLVARDEGDDPERDAILADSLGLALLVVLETLSPAERLAFVLHDLFGLPFEEIAGIVDRSPAAARQLASRARRRVQRAAPHQPERDRTRQREVVDAFLRAAREGDFDGLLAVLDPDIVHRVDRGAAAGGVQSIAGAQAVARGAVAFARLGLGARPVVVNGATGLVGIGPDGRAVSVLSFTVAGGRIVRIDSLLDPERIRRLELDRLWQE
jgi:RNA polymerase sigma factor (sigma-70 family)